MICYKCLFLYIVQIVVNRSAARFPASILGNWIENKAWALASLSSFLRRKNSNLNKIELESQAYIWLRVWQKQP